MTGAENKDFIVHGQSKMNTHVCKICFILCFQLTVSKTQKLTNFIINELNNYVVCAYRKVVENLKKILLILLDIKK